MLHEASQKAVIDTEAMVRAVEEEAKDLLERAQGSLLELQKAGDSFALRSREIAEQMNNSLTTSKKYGFELKSQANEISEASAKTVHDLDQSVKALKSRMHAIGEAANDVSVKVEKTRESLSGESARLVSVSTAALESARTAATTFSKQSDALFKASQDASRYAEKMVEKTQRVQREGFMNAAKFIVESLHSLSVDLTRVKDGEIAEKTWKAFQKGDVAAFTRRMQSIATDTESMDKARNKFAKDTEFRTYVLRFIRQFEELYAQAQENDHGAMLSSTIGSSEIGGLYVTLTEVAGKESVLGGRSEKAA